MPIQILRNQPNVKMNICQIVFTRIKIPVKHS
jgi:hypothetical protein